MQEAAAAVAATTMKLLRTAPARALKFIRGMTMHGMAKEPVCVFNDRVGKDGGVLTDVAASFYWRIKLTDDQEQSV